jgi:hypothetical protein
VVERHYPTESFKDQWQTFLESQWLKCLAEKCTPNANLRLTYFNATRTFPTSDREPVTNLSLDVWREKMATHTDQSIHPRVVNGRTAYPKVNTAARANPETKRKVIAAIEGHLSRHPNDNASKAHLAKLNAA